jgi:DNA uptake protein ComE-like DNA-binding protein
MRLQADVNGAWKVVGNQTATPTPSASTSTLLNINTVSAEDLNGLPMIGMKRARDIVAFHSN